MKRSVKKDGKGLYVHFGGHRLRPIRKETRFEEGNLVSMTDEGDYFNYARRIFNDPEEYEVWGSKKR